ncbi:methyl farnesoate epoxidase-like [Daphnia pulicaria]|uniref:methyl farnesoate epoxidase-like n=1 Tax=Daphnia pulicaria TaxID=35523 RepID=UPI001EEB2655|nr:methyl farnesoate epoxidase-like [Daphnia pulicaria]
MLSVISYLVVSAAVGWIVYWYTLIRTPANYPPGPPGTLSFFSLYKDKEPSLAKAIIKMAGEYGSVIGLLLWHRKFVCISGHQAVADALSNPALSGRPLSFDFLLRTKGLSRGVLMTEGELWKEQRRFTIKHLKDVGVGKSSLEGIILDEIRDLVTDINGVVECSKDGNIMLDDVFTTSVINILWVMVSGTRFKRGDPQMDRLTSCMNGFMRYSNGGPNLLTVVPFIRYIAPELSGYNRLMQYIGPIRSYIEELVSEHRKTLQINSPRDFIDLYLETLIEKESSNNSSFHSFHEEELLGIIFDIFVAGSETTSHTLGFALVFMIMHPHIQNKVQEEIDEVLHGGTPSLTDRGRLPFTEATLQEIQRLGVVAPLTVPHVALQNTKCQGYHIPKGTLTFINLWSTNIDPQVWPEPNTFLPERHLNDAGKFVKSEKLLTFGLGKRSCIGETLARSTLFLFFVSMMQHFRFESPWNDVDLELQPSIEPIPGLTLAPRPCLARVVKRAL